MMTEEEFEVWLDETASMNRMTYENSGFSESSLDYITQDFKCGARAAWAKAQDEIDFVKKCNWSLKKRADKLAEALERWLVWYGDDHGAKIIDGSSGCQGALDIVFGRQTLKEYRGDMMSEEEFKAWLKQNWSRNMQRNYWPCKNVGYAMARAAWAKAQDEFGRIKSVHVEQMNGALLDKQYAEEQADKLAEALEFYADKAKWAMDDRGRSLLDSNLWDDEEKLNSKTWVGGKVAREALKEYRGEK